VCPAWLLACCKDSQLAPQTKLFNTFDTHPSHRHVSEMHGPCFFVPGPSSAETHLGEFFSSVIDEGDLREGFNRTRWESPFAWRGRTQGSITAGVSGRQPQVGRVGSGVSRWAAWGNQGMAVQQRSSAAAATVPNTRMQGKQGVLQQRCAHAQLICRCPCKLATLGVFVTRVGEERTRPCFVCMCNAAAAARQGCGLWLVGSVVGSCPAQWRCGFGQR